MIDTRYIKKLDKEVDFIVDKEFFTGQPILKNGQWVDRNGKLLWRLLIEKCGNADFKMNLKRPGSFRAMNKNENDLRLENCKFINKRQADKLGADRNYSDLTVAEQEMRAYYRPDLVPEGAMDHLPLVTVIDGVTYPNQNHMNIDINTR